MDAVFMSLMAAGMRLLSVLIVFLSLLSFNPISIANNNSNPVGLDELFINVESGLTGFGGFYVENDFLVIVLTATPPAGNLRQIISERLAKVRPEVAEMALAGKVQIVRGDFSFRQLYSIKESLTRISLLRRWFWLMWMRGETGFWWVLRTRILLQMF
jgi:hypothetical protein